MATDRVLNGRYEVGELIGRGGMADVHLGRDIRLGRSVAIKVLRRDLARDPLFQSRFRREAQAVAGLNNSNIVSVFDTGEEEIPDRPEHEVRVPFIVMEYVPGRTLREFVKSGELTVADALVYMSGVLSALEYSHKAGIVHRDIKPANVMITPDGRVKVMDFGIARAIADSAATMTQTQAVIGTAQYLSPEQARGETVDARSDLYSAGCLLYELLTGRPPFIGDSPVSVAYQHVREEALPPSNFTPGVSAAMDSVLHKALQKDRADRFQDAAEFRTALNAAERGIGVDSPSLGAGSTETEALAALPAHTAAFGAATLDDDGPRTRAMARAAALPASTADEAPLDLGLRDEDSRPSRDHRKQGRTGWIAVLVVAVLAVLAGGAFLLLNLSTPEPEAAPTVAVPVVEGLTEADATNAVYSAQLVPFVEQQFNATVDQGLVVSSNPRAGAQVKEDTRITLVVSKGPANRAVPESIVGMTESSARDALSSAGLTGGEITEENSATVPQGRVISSDPQPGQSVPVDSPVNLVLSTGKVTVPSLIDLTREVAEATLADPAINLPVTVKLVDNTVVEPGLVIGQSEEPRSSVDQGTEIVLEVSQRPKPKETPSPEPTATATATPAPG